MSVVSSDDAQSHSLPPPSPLPLSSLFLTHWPATCSLFLLPITCSSVLCSSCYMSMSLVLKNALWLSHVLVYWIKENPNIIVINTNNITIQYERTHQWQTKSTFKLPPWQQVQWWNWNLLPFMLRHKRLKLTEQCLNCLTWNRANTHTATVGHKCHIPLL